MNRNVCLHPDRFHSLKEEMKLELPYSESTEILRAPLAVGAKTLPNRLACQAMEGCDGLADGAPGELTVRRYLRFARGGAGLIWFEATACLAEARANPRQLMLTKENADTYKRLLHDIRETSLRENGYAPVIVMQNTHSGRHSKPHGFPEPIIAYNNPLFEKDRPIDPSRIITDEGLDATREAMVSMARLAEEVGFDGVDIKCCHGYLNAELLSAYTRENSRYGGSYENRTRLLRETVAQTMDACSKDFLVSSRLNVYDGFPYPYGFGVKEGEGTAVALDEAIRLIGELHALGMPLINISMGNPYVNPHVNRPFFKGAYEHEEHPMQGVARVLEGIAAIKKQVPDMLLLSSALSWLGTAAPHVAAGYMERGDFDVAGFGRLILAYPDFAKDILCGEGLDPKRCCIACSKCTELMRSGSTPGCVVRDAVYTELYQQHLAAKKS